MSEKSDSGLIKAKLLKLQDADWLRTKKWQPKYLFHFTDILNAANILKSDFIYSRKLAVLKGLMENDNASSQIIQNTEEEHKNYVRLYFRPRTPTQYQIEGFIPIAKQYHKAHCPMPIMFVFYSEPILIDENTEFTNGSYASSNAQKGGSGIFYSSLCFEDIYHDSATGYLGSSRKREIIFHRQAEVLIKDRLSLENLASIACRSKAEYETLKAIMPDEIWSKWHKLIKIDSLGTFFFKRNPFVDEVRFSRKELIFIFNESSESSQQSFHICVRIIGGKEELLFEISSLKDISLSKQLRLDISNLTDLGSFGAELYIDSHLAYKSFYSEENILF